MDDVDTRRMRRVLQSPFVRSPVWIAGHLLVVVTIVAFVSFGFWQLRRLDEVRADRIAAEQRMTGGPVSLQRAVADAGGDPTRLAYELVEVTGTYLTDAQIATQPRSRDGRPVNLLLTPLQPSGGGAAVLVERGAVPFDRNGVRSAEAVPPSGEVTVRGVLLPPEGGPDADAVNDAGVATLVNPPALAEDLAVDLLPTPLRLLAQRPTQAGPLPLAGRPPELDEGNHLSYAVQWFSFALVVAVGYPILLVRRVRERAEAHQHATV